MRRLCRSTLIAALFLVPVGVCPAAAGSSGLVRCSGKVVDPNGGPVAGAKVKVQGVRISMDTCSYELKLIQELATGEAGTFAFETKPGANGLSSECLISAVKEGLALGCADWRMGGDVEVEIRLGRAKSLSGTVVDEAGRPIADAEVGIGAMLARGGGKQERYFLGDMARGLATTKTDVHGRFSLCRLPADATLELLVRKPGRATINTFASRGYEGGSLQFSPGRTDVQVVQPPEARVEGAVVEKANGRPVAGVKVAMSQGPDLPGFSRRSTAGDHGRFTFDGLAPGTYLVRPAFPTERMAEWVGDPVTVSTQAGRTQTGVKVELCRGGVLEVFVAEAGTKTPVEKASVSIQPADGRTGSNSQASADGYGIKNVQAAAEAAEDRCLDLGTFTLAVANMSAAGTVVDVNDKPAAGASVSVYGVDKPFNHVIADANGRFTVQKICAGRIQISANNNLGPPMADGDATAEAGDMDIRVIINERASSGQRIQIPSLKGKPLPDLKGVGVTAAGVEGKSLLVCMVDIEQRPSRKCLSDLAKKTEVLTAKGASIIVIQTSQTDVKQYGDWLKTNQVAFPIHAVEGDFEVKKTAWGVKALPWLILTDKDRKVVAEGFAVSEVESVVGKIQ